MFRFFKSSMFDVWKVGKLREELSKFGQEHLLDHWDTITEQERRELYNEIKVITFADYCSFLIRFIYSINFYFNNNLRADEFCKSFPC